MSQAPVSREAQPQDAHAQDGKEGGLQALERIITSAGGVTTSELRAAWTLLRPTGHSTQHRLPRGADIPGDVLATALDGLERAADLHPDETRVHQIFVYLLPSGDGLPGRLYSPALVHPAARALTHPESAAELQTARSSLGHLHRSPATQVILLSTPLQDWTPDVGSALIQIHAITLPPGSTFTP